MTLSWKEVLQIPETIQKSQSLLADFDRCFLVGFSRLGEDHLDTLSSLTRIFGPTPLGEALSQSIEALERSEFTEQHFQRLAAVRAALQGAQHDALLAHLSGGWGRTLAASPVATKESEQAPVGLTEGTRQWLTEIALAGFPQLTIETLSPFANTLEQLQQSPAGARLALLLTGFLDELSSAVPISSPDHVPLARWVDLWTRSMLLAVRTPASNDGTSVSGSFYPMGVDIHHHPFAMSYTVHGLLQEKDGAPRWVRSTHTSYKVDVLQDIEAWQLFDSDPLLDALNAGKSAEVKEGTLLESGDLLLNDKTKLGKAYDPLALAKEHLSPEASAPAIYMSASPIDRHPVQIAFPVYVEDAQRVSKDDPSLQFDGCALRIAEERVSTLGGIDENEIKKASGIIGLLRYDQDGFALQPLGLIKDAKKGKLLFAGQEASKQAAAKKSKVLENLKERSTRLLRK
ncbi:MAG: hypothetical protein H6727_20575 [Myxococcales bacterium]|nr:hypothetical protein [Myxococcales bacterium]